MIEKVLQALEPFGVRSAGKDSWRSRCPAHEGKSDDVLKVDLQPNGKLLLHCHGGCPTESVLKALDLNGRDLFPTDTIPSARNSEMERQKRAADDERKRQKAIARARLIWRGATPARSDHPYLKRKQVSAVDTLRELPVEMIAKLLGYWPKGKNGNLTGRILLAPIKIDGELSSLEMIDESGRKAAIVGSAKKGGYWAAQELPDDDGGFTLSIGEGLATALSAREATGNPAVACFGCGNMSHVARYFRDRYPAAAIIVLADLGNGEASAKSAAEAINGRLVVPSLPPGQGSDFNDLACLRGNEAVRDAINAAIEDRGPPAEEIRQDGPFKIIESTRGFRNGVYFFDDGAEGESLPPVFICSPLRILALTRDIDGESWGRLLEWRDPEGMPHRWAMPSRMLSGTGEEYRSQLLDGGLEIAPGTKARNHLATYIQSERTETLARCTERTGWHGGQFVLPDRIIGTGREKIVFQSVGHSAAHYGEQGTLADWRREVAALCIGQSRLAFCVSIAFAAPLLELVGDENGGVHLQGGTSTGKTTVLHVAASVFGPREYLHRWRATANGLEAVAASHSGTVLILDEMGQIDAREAGEVGYMLANGLGKHRATRSGGARKAQSWRLLFLSSGETDLAQHMLSVGKKAKAGQEIRLLSFDADAGKGFGVFDHVGGFGSGASLSRALLDRSARFYGVAGPAFIDAVSQELADIPRQSAAFRKVFLERNLPDGASGQAERAAQRFALIGFAGELASAFGITGWVQGESEDAAAICFKAWLEGRGGAGDRETQAILAQVVRFFEAHGESRFHDWSSPNERPVINRAGVRRQEGNEWVYFVLSETFKQEICAGHSTKLVCRAMEDAGILERGSEGKPAGNRRLPGIGLTRCYKLRPFREK